MLPQAPMMTQQQPLACSRRCGNPVIPRHFKCLPAAAPATTQQARRTVRVHAATKQHTDATRSSTAAGRLACAAAAAAALVASPASAAGDTPSYGPWAFFNVTPWEVELFFNFADCPSQFGGANPYSQFTYPFPRGACDVSGIHATAVVQDKPGGPPRIVAEADWSPTAPNSQDYSEWVVIQMAPLDAPSIRVLHILD